MHAKDDKMAVIETIVDQGSGIAATLNRDLVTRLSELDSGAYAASECWSSSRPLVRETLLWIAIAIVFWIGAIVYLLACPA
jgi:hypothetical protein